MKNTGRECNLSSSRWDYLQSCTKSTQAKYVKTSWDFSSYNGTAIKNIDGIFFSPTIVTNCKSWLYNFFKRRLKMLISNDSRAVSRGEILDKQEKATDSWKQVATNAFQQPGQFQKRNIIFCLSMRSLLVWIATTSDIYVYHELLTITYFTT